MHPEDYKYSSAGFYETGIDEFGIEFRILSHYKDTIMVDLVVGHKTNNGWGGSYITFFTNLKSRDKNRNFVVSL